MALSKNGLYLMDQLLNITASITNLYQKLCNYDENYQKLLNDLKLAIIYEERLIQQIYE